MEEIFFRGYFPENFCREFVEVKGSCLQLGMYMSLVLGIKPLMDDWIPADRIDEFRKICKKYGVFIRENVMFLPVAKEEIPGEVIGKDFITTTSAYGYPLESGFKDKKQVHVFLSRDRKFLSQGMWYPVIIKGRVIFQPRADTLNYGYVLGYPDCCIRFFKKYNNWLRYSHLYEVYRNSKGKFNFLCNPFLKNTTYSYVYHTPCSYNCKNTVKLAGRLRSQIKKREPGYVELTDRFLKMPFLVLYENKYYAFEGELKNNTLRYKKSFFCSVENTSDVYSDDFKKADSLNLEGRRLSLYKRGKLFKVIDVPLNRFAPEFPFLIQFS